MGTRDQQRAGARALLWIAIHLVASLVGLVSLARPAAADFQYQVYGGSFIVLPNFTSLTPIASGQSTTVALSVTPLVDNFGLVFTNTIQTPTAGTYEFYTNSDDGSMLYIDGTTVVSNDGLHGPRTMTGTYTFASAGKFPIRVTFYEQGGGQVLVVRYNLGTTNNYATATPIPDNKLFLTGGGEALARIAAPEEELAGETDDNQDVQAWPMPFQNRLNLAFKKASGLESLVLLDRMGVPVMTIPVSPLDDEMVVDFQELPEGHYFLVVGRKTIRIVKRN